MKKGTARLALSSWEDGIPLRVLPVAINYSLFRKFGKNVKLYFGSCITLQDIGAGAGYGRCIQQFNAMLLKQLKPFVYEINKSEKTHLKKSFYVPQHWAKKVLLSVPVVAGWMAHAPLYIPVKRFVQKRLNSSDHYDQRW